MTKPTVLIVDDEPIAIQILAKILEKECEIKVATDGYLALNIVNQFPVPDLLLLDVMMPSIDGFAVCEMLKADPVTANIPVIFITAAGRELECSGFLRGAVDYIVKPFNPAAALLRIRTQLEVNRYRAGLHENLSFLDIMLNHAPIGLAIVSRNGKWSFANKFALQLLDCSDISELEDISFNQLFSVNPFRVFRAVCKAFHGCYNRLRLRISNTNKKSLLLDIKLLPIQDSRQNRPALFISAIVINEQERMRQYQLLLSKVFENAPEAVLITDLKGRVVLCNPAYCKITGYSKYEILASHYGFPQSTDNAERFVSLLQHVEAKGAWKGEFKNKCKNGDLLNLWMTISTIENKANFSQYYLVIFHDMTQLGIEQELITTVKTVMSRNE